MKFDAIVVGGGLVGASAALALARSDVQVAMIERQRSAPLDLAASNFDQRVFSLTPKVRRWLETLEVWQQLRAERVAPIHHMSVYGDAGGAIEFDAIETGRDALAYVVEQRELLSALWRVLETHPNVRIIAPAHGAGLQWDDDAVRLQLAGVADEALHGALLVAADGGDSWVRTTAQIEVVERAYAQRALVANFSIERPHRGTALQWFQEGGVLAWLPLPAQQISIVWSASDGLAQELLALSDDEFTRRVAQAGGERLGALRLTTPRASFPLRLLRTKEWVRPRLALIGDAAHCVHPLAGQGVNLGFDDVACLAQVIAERGAQQDCGDFFLLRCYERARKESALVMQGTVDALQRLFSHPGGWTRTLRNTGLSAVARAAWIKKRLARHAMG